ncbi:hypothetical protein ACVWZM_002132 [Bradyrhizobium sp. USDA 4501]
MRTPPQTFGTLAATLSAGVLLFATQTALAQTASPPNATATRPARVLPDQNSVPSSGPPATTGQASRDPTIKQMNDDEKRKVDTKGK